MAVQSAAALIWPQIFYSDRETLSAFLPNDAVNLAVLLPAATALAFLVRRKRLFGLCLLPGVLLQILYNTIVQTVGTRFSLLAIPYILIFFLAASDLYLSFTTIRGEVVKKSTAGKIRERIAGGVLAAFGTAFLLMAGVQAGASRLQGEAITAAQAGLHAADLIIAVPWISGGAALFRRRVFGYQAAGGLALHAALSFLGLLVFLLVRPALTSMPLDYRDVLSLATFTVPVVSLAGFFLARIGRLLRGQLIL